MKRLYETLLIGGATLVVFGCKSSVSDHVAQPVAISTHHLAYIGRSSNLRLEFRNCFRLAGIRAGEQVALFANASFPKIVVLASVEGSGVERARWHVLDDMNGDGVWIMRYSSETSEPFIARDVRVEMRNERFVLELYDPLRGRSLGRLTSWSVESENVDEPVQP